MRLCLIALLALTMSGCAAHQAVVAKRTSKTNVYVACLTAAGPYWAGPVQEVEVTKDGWLRWVSLQTKETLTSNGNCLVVESPLKPLSSGPSTESDTKPTIVIVPSD